MFGHHWLLLLQDAAQRALDFGLGQYADPIFLGDYPDSVKQRTSIPPLTDVEKAALKGSVDWFALNHYTSYYVKDDPTGASGPHGYTTSYYSASGEPLGAQAESVWLYVYPPGLRWELQSAVHALLGEHCKGIAESCVQLGTGLTNEGMRSER